MTSQQKQCYDLALLKSFLQEQLTDAEEQGITEHIGECSQCREQLESLAAGGKRWEDYQENLIDHTFEKTLELGSSPSNQPIHNLESIKSLLGPTDDPAMLGRLGSYEICGVVGRGSAGVVFKAFDSRLNRYVAIKMLAPAYSINGSSRLRFEREGRAVAAVRDDHVIPIYGVDEFKNTPYIVMQYMPSGSLEKRLVDDGQLSTRAVVRIGMQVANGLAAAHRQGIIHRDVKPANVLLEAGLERAIVTDFGLARVLDEATMTQSGSISGTPQFMSPEQARGESLDPRTDLFSLGCVMYAACTGHSPFRSETLLGVMHRVCETQPRPIRESNPEIESWLAAFIDKLLEKNRENRFESAVQVSNLLAEELAHLQSPTVAPEPKREWWQKEVTPRTSPNFTRNISLIGGIVALAFFGWALYGYLPTFNSPNLVQDELKVQSPEQLLEQAKQEEETEKKAKEAFQKAYEIHIDEAENGGNMSKAIKAHELAIELGHDVPTSTYNLACAYALRGETDKAISLLSKSVREGFSDTRTLKRDSDMDSLREDARFKRILSQMKQIARLRNSAERAFEMKNYKTALDDYRKLLKMVPSDDYAVVHIGASLIFMGNVEESIAWHERAAKTDYAYLGNYNLACAAALKGESEKALDYLKKAIETGFTDPQYIEEDKDFESIRELPRFQSLVKFAGKNRYAKWQANSLGRDLKDGEDASDETKEENKAEAEKEAACELLIQAIEADKLDEVKDLLKSTDPNCTCPDYVSQRNFFGLPRRSPLVVAAKLDKVEIAKALIKAKADVSFTAKNEITPLMAASENGNLELVKLFLGNGSDIHRNIPGRGTALIHASKKGNLATVKHLVKNGSEVDTQSPGVGTAILVAARNGHSEAVEFFAEKDANVNVKVAGVGSPLSAAAASGHVEVAKELLKLGAEVDAGIPGVGTPFLCASKNHQVEMMKYLLKNGADVNGVVAGVGSALTNAIKNQDLEKVKALLEAGASLDVQTPGVGNALIIAVRVDDIEIAKYLVSKGADVNYKVAGVGTPLSMATRNGYLDIAQFLIKEGADVNSFAPGTNTPLGYAVQSDFPEVVKVLIEKGADPNAKGNARKTALEYAEKMEDELMIELLEESGDE